MRQCNIQIAVIARLPAHEGVNRPSAVDIDFNAVFFKKID